MLFEYCCCRQPGNHRPSADLGKLSNNSTTNFTLLLFIVNRKKIKQSLGNCHFPPLTHFEQNRVSGSPFIFNVASCGPAAALLMQPRDKVCRSFISVFTYLFSTPLHILQPKGEIGSTSLRLPIANPSDRTQMWKPCKLHNTSPHSGALLW